MIPPSPNEFSGLDCLSTGAMVLDADDRILYVNPAAETLLGVSGALLVGDDADQVFERSPELLGGDPDRAQRAGNRHRIRTRCGGERTSADSPRMQHFTAG